MSKRAEQICLLHKSELDALLTKNVRPDCSSGRHAHISEKEAEEMKFNDEIGFVSHYYAKKGTFAYRKKGKPTKRDAATLKKGHMMANAGVLGNSRTAHLTEAKREELLKSGKLKREEDFIEIAQNKIQAWPEVGDTKAVCVRPAHRTDEAAYQKYFAWCQRNKMRPAPYEIWYKATQKIFPVSLNNFSPTVRPKASAIQVGSVASV